MTEDADNEEEGDITEHAESEGARDYLHDMLKELAIMASKCGERFIADALNMVLQEAKRPSRNGVQ